MVGMQCGGSDGFSGLSANPALGAAMDILVRHGGTAILSETTEIFGVEHMLTARAVTPEVGRKLIDRIAWWLEVQRGTRLPDQRQGQPRQQRRRSRQRAGEVARRRQEGRQQPADGSLQYAEPVTAKGLVFMDTPGYDPASATGQIAGGANMICFTTGRGSCFGSVPAPTMKLASNTPMYTRMQADMDINCGVIIDGEATIAEMGQRIFEQLLRHASGEKTKSESSGMGENEFVPWPIGVLS